MNEIEKYYNKFNEDKRLLTRHGIVEFTVSLKYILSTLKAGDKIIDVGAGTGRYSVYLSNKGYDVTAVELVKKNLSTLKQKNSGVKAYLGNALNLSKFNSDAFDVCILFGPMYHLFTKEDKLKALSEAKRVTKKGGHIFVAYLLADYAILKHGIMDNNLRTSLVEGKIDKSYNILSEEKDLYSYVRLEQINELNRLSGLKREKIFSPDGPTDYIRSAINKLSKQDFEYYINYQIANAERADLMGASSHVVDVLVVEK